MKRTLRKILFPISKSEVVHPNTKPGQQYEYPVGTWWFYCTRCGEHVMGSRVALHQDREHHDLVELCQQKGKSFYREMPF